ncbi:choice-of-anchor Q domain-containing protein [Corallococcus aberystwythensis]|nr:choice-of-anchor Q domain-containing protein [Corallococcus aberystwythensis]
MAGLGLMMLASPAHAAVSHLYVATTGNDSTGNGSSGSPYKTILRASQAATPGAIIHVAPGTYSASFLTTKSGTATDRIRYVSETDPATGARARIVPPNTTATTGIVWENRGAYVDIDGFEFDGTGTKMPNALLNQGSYVTISNNHVHHIANGSNQPCNSGGGSGINIVDTAIPGLMTGTVVTRNKVHDIGYNCKYIQNIYISTRATVTNNLSYNNTAGAGIHLWHDAHEVVIANNTIYNTWMGIIVGGGNYYEYSGPADYVDVSNNIVVNNDYGISLQGATGSHNTYTNNLVYQNTHYHFSPGANHTGTVIAPPQFVNAAGGDFHLAPGSLAINAGSPAFAPSVDLDGNPRPVDGLHDIGAYEYGGSTPGQVLTFWEKDSVAGPTSGYWFKQALVNGVVVWESDVTADGTAWQSHSVAINPTGASFNLQFRLISKAGVSNYPISVNIDDVAINGVTVTNAGFETATGWTYAETKTAFTGSFDTGAFHGGAASYKLFYPGATLSAAGDNSTVSQTLQN